MNREGALRIDQRTKEPPDMFAMRAFMKAVPYMRRHEAVAAARWMLQKARDRSTPLIGSPMRGKSSWTAERIALRAKFLERKARRVRGTAK